VSAAACALFRVQGPAWYGCKVQHAPMCGSCCLCPFQGSGSSMVWDQSSIVWELLPLPFSGFRGQHGGWELLPVPFSGFRVVWQLLPVPFSGFRGQHGGWSMGGGSCCLSLVLWGQCLWHRKARCLIWPVREGPGWCGNCCLCPFQGLGSSLLCGSWCLCPFHGLGSSMGCGGKVQHGGWELLPVLGLMGLRSPAQEGQMPDMACQGGARMVWELLPVPFSGFRVQYGMGARFSMLCGSCCLCPFQGSGSSMVWEQSPA
jgi:hypothetical protein